MSGLKPQEAGDSVHSDRCRSCGSAHLTDVLSLGHQPLANSLRRPTELDRPEPRYPLDLALCAGCSLVQITDSVPPERSSATTPTSRRSSPSLVEHARSLAARMIASARLGADSLVIELASNDGYLLQHYRDAGVPVLGIEPARNIAAAAEERGIPTRCAFFGRDLAAELAAEGVRPDVVHAHNVLAHVPDLNGFVAGIAALLGDRRGVAVIEVPVREGPARRRRVRHDLPRAPLLLLADRARPPVRTPRAARSRTSSGSRSTAARCACSPRREATAARRTTPCGRLLDGGGRLGRRPPGRLPRRSPAGSCEMKRRLRRLLGRAEDRGSRGSPPTAPRPRAARC